MRPPILIPGHAALQVLCNACGIYVKTHGRARPVDGSLGHGGQAGVAARKLAAATKAAAACQAKAATRKRKAQAAAAGATAAGEHLPGKGSALSLFLQTRLSHCKLTE